MLCIDLLYRLNSFQINSVLLTSLDIYCHLSLSPVSPSKQLLQLLWRLHWHHDSAWQSILSRSAQLEYSQVIHLTKISQCANLLCCIKAFLVCNRCWCFRFIFFMFLSEIALQCTKNDFDARAMFIDFGQPFRRHVFEGTSVIDLIESACDSTTSFLCCSASSYSITCDKLLDPLCFAMRCQHQHLLSSPFNRLTLKHSIIACVSSYDNDLNLSNSSCPAVSHNDNSIWILSTKISWT